jgi:hypothetical protein
MLAPQSNNHLCASADCSVVRHPHAQVTISSSASSATPSESSTAIDNSSLWQGLW